MDNNRILKVQEQIRRILAGVLLKEKDSFGIGIVSINDILVSRDLSTAKVLVSFIAEDDQEKVFQKLIRRSGTIQTHLYKNFPVKRVPKIIWLLDKEPGSTYRIEKLLDDIHSTTGENRDFPEANADRSADSDSITSQT